MTDKTEDALNVSLAHPGTNYLAETDEIKNMPKNAIFPTANYPYETKMKRRNMKKKRNYYKLNWQSFNTGLKIADKNT